MKAGKNCESRGAGGECAGEYLKNHSVSLSPDLWASHKTQQRLEKGSFGFRESYGKASLCTSLQWGLFSLHFQSTDTLYCFTDEGYIIIKKSKLIGVRIYVCYPYFGFSFRRNRLLLTSIKETWGGQKKFTEPILQLLWPYLLNHFTGLNSSNTTGYSSLPSLLQLQSV